MNFKTQAENFLTSIQNRRRNPVRVGTLAQYRSLLNVHILPALGNKTLAEIENGVLKDFNAYLYKQELSSSTIISIVSLVKQVIGSAVDENGNELYPRKWNSDFIDLPVINTREQDAPAATAGQIQKALKLAQGQDRALYALLAGTGLRVGEALALMVGEDDGRNSFWNPAVGVITVRTTLVKGQIQETTKTEAGIREIDLSTELNDFLKANLSTETGLLFKNRDGRLTRIQTAYDHLRLAGIDDGFHSFRRFRCTHLEAQNVPPGLQRFWTGHASGDVHESYIKMGDNLEIRKLWAQKAGLGFQLNAGGVA